MLCSLPLLVAQESGWTGATEELSQTGDNPTTMFSDVLVGRLDILSHPDEMLTALTNVHPVWATIFVVTGGICLFNGYRWHKGVILILAGMLGIWAGLSLGDQIGGAHTVAAASVALLFVVLALPGLRFAVALFGGLAGGFCGANAWTAFGGEADLHYVGAIVGLIAVSMLAFLAFRLVIVLFTSIGGASLVVLGALALMLRVESWSGGLVNGLETNPRVVPLVVAVLAAVSLITQLGGGVRGLNAVADKADPKKKPGAQPA